MTAFVLGALSLAVGDSNNDDSTGTGGTILTLVTVAVAIALFIPSLAVTWRRLHDAGFAGPWCFLQFIPVVGSLTVLVMCLLPTSPSRQKAIWDDPQRQSVWVDVNQGRS